jgi:hypothetical protein
MPNKRTNRKTISYALGFACIVVAAIVALIWLLPAEQVTFSDVSTSTPALTAQAGSTTPPAFAIAHIKTPASVRAVYFTSWAAGTPSFQKQLFALFAATSTQLNSIVIDIKDYSGRIGYVVDDPRFDDKTIDAMGSAQDRIPDIEHFIASLHARGIYVIGRVQSFNDPFAVTVHPQWYIRTASGAIWKDSGGANWINPADKAAWSYIADIAKQGYGVGFDEINFDYVRFPSDGVGTAVFDTNASTTKADVITSFFSYLHSTLAPLGIPISADVFGQTTSDPGDMGIGQHFENVLPYFNFVDPMVYPSHYINGFDGYANPAEHPYAIVNYAMDHAVDRAVAASSSPAEIRPWLQAFDLGAVYTPAFVQDQMQATENAGLSSWLLWNAGSVYSRYAPMFSEPAPTPAVSSSTARR